MEAESEPPKPGSTGPADPQAPGEPDRRLRARPSGSTPSTTRRARLRADSARYYPSLRPDGWYALVDRDPEAIEPDAQEVYVWIEVDGRPRQVWSAHFEIRSGAPSSNDQS